MADPKAKPETPTREVRRGVSVLACPGVFILVLGLAWTFERDGKAVPDVSWGGNDHPPTDSDVLSCDDQFISGFFINRPNRDMTTPLGVGSGIQPVPDSETPLIQSKTASLEKPGEAGDLAG